LVDFELTLVEGEGKPAGDVFFWTASDDDPAFPASGSACCKHMYIHLKCQYIGTSRKACSVEASVCVYNTMFAIFSRR
jgi:hypothetical protein